MLEGVVVIEIERLVIGVNPEEGLKVEINHEQSVGSVERLGISRPIVRTRLLMLGREILKRNLLTRKIKKLTVNTKICILRLLL